MQLDLNTGQHRHGGEWKYAAPETAPVTDPAFLENLRLAYKREVCFLPPPVDCSLREVPKRSPLCWKNNPPDADYNKNFVLSDTIFLDKTFRRLYQGSPSFKAMLALSPNVSKVTSMLWEPNGFNAEYQFEFQEVDVNMDLTTNSNLVATPLAAIAHEYRHHYQRVIKAVFHLADSIELHYYFALCLAAEADAICFGFICAYEVLLSEGHTPQSAQKILFTEKEFLDSDLTRAFIKAAQLDSESHLTGLFSEAVIASFLIPDNELKKKYIRTYSEIYMGQMGHRLQFAKACQDNPLFKTQMKLANLNDDGNLAIITPDSSSATSKVSKEIFQISFDKLKSLPFIGYDGNLVQRPQYMKGLKGQEFFDILFAP